MDTPPDTRVAVRNMRERIQATQRSSLYMLHCQSLQAKLFGSEPVRRERPLTRSRRRVHVRQACAGGTACGCCGRATWAGQASCTRS
eukprot:1067287-Rhodomonas_salina.2